MIRRKVKAEEKEREIILNPFFLSATSTLGEKERERREEEIIVGRG